MTLIRVGTGSLDWRKRPTRTSSSLKHPEAEYEAAEIHEPRRNHRNGQESRARAETFAGSLVAQIKKGTLGRE